MQQFRFKIIENLCIDPFIDILLSDTERKEQTTSDFVHFQPQFSVQEQKVTIIWWRANAEVFELQWSMSKRMIQSRRGSATELQSLPSARPRFFLCSNVMGEKASKSLSLCCSRTARIQDLVRVALFKDSVSWDQRSANLTTPAHCWIQVGTRARAVLLRVLTETEAVWHQQDSELNTLLRLSRFSAKKSRTFPYVWRSLQKVLFQTVSFVCPSELLNETSVCAFLKEHFKLLAAKVTPETRTAVLTNTDLPSQVCHDRAAVLILAIRRGRPLFWLGCNWENYQWRHPGRTQDLRNTVCVIIFGKLHQGVVKSLCKFQTS